MQSPPQAPPPAYVPPAPRNRLPMLLGIGAVVLLVIGGVAGYLIGSAGLGQATFRVDVENRLASTLTVQVTVNGRLAGTLAIPTGQTMSVSVPVSYATANGASFEIVATSTLGPQDSSTVIVNTPGTYVVSLSLG